MSGDNDNPMIPLDAKAAGEAPSASHGAGNGAMPPQPDLTEIRKQLFTRGYKILPNRGKAPVIKGWSDTDYLARELTDSSNGTVPEKIERWSRRFPDAHSTGVWLWDKLRVIDIDVSDAAMVKALLDAIRKHAPEIADRAPMRFGAPIRVALFVRAPDHEEPMKLFNPAGDLIYAGKTTFNLIRSFSYRRPGEADDAPTHAVDIFGGEPTKAGKCSRQFGVYGPHSYNDDGTVAREYGWASDRPALHEIDLADLPALSYATACEIIGAFDALAKAAGWVRVEPPKEAAPGSLAYDIDEATRFDVQHGPDQITYDELCDMQAGRTDLRVSSSFIDGGSNRSKCWVFWSPRHDCVAVYDHGTLVTHYPSNMATLIDDDGSMNGLWEQLRKLRDDGGGSGKAATAAELPQEDEADAQGGAPPRDAAAADGGNRGVTIGDFWAYMPKHLYIFAPTGEMWPAASINARLPKIPVVKKDGMQAVDSNGKPRSMSPSVWLDRHRAVEQMTWVPGAPQIVADRLITEGGWFERPGTTTFNLYRPPLVRPGNAANAGRWVELEQRIYPDDVGDIITYCAHRVQQPAVKINHGILLGGIPGIGKDTLLEPLKLGVGPWNFREVSPQDIMGNYNDYMRCVVLRISEARDLGEVNRYAFHNHMKTITATPPDVIRVNGKYIPQHYVINVAGVIYTTNHRFDSLYLPPDDRRTFVAWSEACKEQFADGFWKDLWGWYGAGGLEDVVAYLAEYDLSRFDPKAPPRKTEAFWQIARHGEAPEVSELADVLAKIGLAAGAVDASGKPCRPVVTTVARVMNVAGQEARYELYTWLNDRRNRAAMAYRFESCGYAPVRNDTAKDGLWVIRGKRQVVYGRLDVSVGERIAAVRRLISDQ